MQNSLSLRQDHIFSNLKMYYKEPLEVTRAEGRRVWSSDGDEYLDMIGGIVTISVGHHHPRIKSRLIEMLEANVPQHTSTLYLNEFIGQAAKELTSHFDDNERAVYFTNSGSEANEIAMLTAREATKKKEIISLRHSYHGGTQGTLNQCGHRSWKFSNQPSSNGIFTEAPYCYRCPYQKNKEDCHVPCAETLNLALDTYTSGDVAAIIVEPVMGVGGFIDGPKKYFERIAELAKAHNFLIISDEVQTGVGRLGENFFGIQDFGIDPDIVTMAKGLGNGVPVGACIAKKSLVSHLEGKTHFNTFGGDPFVMAQVDETLKIIREENLIENARQRGRQIQSGLRELQNKFKSLGDIRGRGLLLGVEIVDESGDFNPALCQELMERLKVEKVLVGKGGLYGNVIRIAPPLSITEQETSEFLQSFAKALDFLAENHSFC